MQLREFMKEKLKTVTGDITLKEAAAIMDAVETGVLPVMEGSRDNPSDNAIGVITDRDIVIRCVSLGKDPNTTTVADAFTPGTVACMEDETDGDALQKMRDERVGRVLVKGEGNALRGIVSLADIMARMAGVESSSIRLDVN